MIDVRLQTEGEQVTESSTSLESSALLWVVKVEVGMVQDNLGVGEV